MRIEAMVDVPVFEGAQHGSVYQGRRAVSMKKKKTDLVEAFLEDMAIKTRSTNQERRAVSRKKKKTTGLVVAFQDSGIQARRGRFGIKEGGW